MHGIRSSRVDLSLLCAVYNTLDTKENHKGLYKKPVYPRHTSTAMKSPPKVSKSATSMTSPPKVSKSATTKKSPCQLWRDAKARRARENTSTRLIAKAAKELFGHKWTLTPGEVRKLLDLIFRVAIDQMRETRRSFNLAGMVLLKPKVIKECKDRIMKNPATGRNCWITWKPARSSVTVKPLKSLTRMAMLRDPHFLKRAEERHGKI